MYLQGKRFRHFLAIVLVIFISAGFILPKSSAAGEYIPSNRDTSKSPSTMDIKTKEPSDYELLYEGKDLCFYYKEDRDILAVRDKRNGYVWKTGLDIPSNKEIQDNINEAVEKGIKPEYTPQEDKLNATYTDIANSLITVEYYDDANNIKRVSSGSSKGIEREMKKVGDNHYRQDIRFKSLGLSIKVHIYFDEDGIRYEVKDGDIEGKGVKKFSAILITPFLGASGGKKVHWNEKDNKYNIVVPNEMTPGYVFLPDGSGALMRFKDNATLLKSYVGEVYGSDYSQSKYYYTDFKSYIPFKNPSLPVFGISHGNKQNAFCAYAIEGGEHLEIIAMPEENMTNYNWAYPRFVYNSLFHQVYNKKGDGYFTLMEDRNHFNINIKYDFLQGDGSEGRPSADYVGMAQVYRNFLLDNNLIKKGSFNKEDISVRIDFLMADSKRNILGNEDVVVTNIKDVENILKYLHEGGIENINSGLYGWQKGGVTLAKPWAAAWKRGIGTSGDFRKAKENLAGLGIDISLAQNYALINPKQMALSGNASKHVNGFYNKYTMPGYMVDEFYFSRPIKAVEWLDRQTKLINSKTDIESITIDGISNILISDYSSGKFDATNTIAIYKNAFEKLDKDYTINATSPNSYLWKYVDRFLQMPVFNTQFLIETDTVPFLQLVLAGSVEMYAPYANFSFYTDSDILRMVDYNVYPSFVLTEKSAHYLSYTNSSDYYSTEYDLYSDLIKKVYKKVNDALKYVKGKKWYSRDVVEEGFVVNRYDGGFEIAINYTDNPIKYKNKTVDPISYLVFP